jgi:transposase InsO family protein
MSQSSRSRPESTRASTISQLSSSRCLNRRHLEHVLLAYIDHYNTQRPHRALKLQPPDPDEPAPPATSSEIHRRDRLGGILHEYYRAAA